MVRYDLDKDSKVFEIQDFSLPHMECIKNKRMVRNGLTLMTSKDLVHLP